MKIILFKVFILIVFISKTYANDAVKIDGYLNEVSLYSLKNFKQNLLTIQESASIWYIKHSTKHIDHLFKENQEKYNKILKNIKTSYTILDNKIDDSSFILEKLYYIDLLTLRSEYDFNNHDLNILTFTDESYYPFYSDYSDNINLSFINTKPHYKLKIPKKKFEIFKSLNKGEADHYQSAYRNYLHDIFLIFMLNIFIKLQI